MSETESPEMTIRGPGRFFLPGPSIALFIFAQALTDSVITDLIVYRTCLVSLNVSETNCSMLHTNASSPEARDLETKIEPYASKIIMAQSLVRSILSAVLSLFLGAWSDRSGRRPLLLAAYTSFTLMYFMFSLMCNWNISPWYLLIPSITGYVTGGYGAIILASLCYISDTAEEKDRTIQLAWLQATVFTGMVLGIFIGPLIYNRYGYTSVLSIAAICCALALLYFYFYVPETVKDVSKESILGLFKISVVKDLVNSSLVERTGFHRSVVWITIFILTMDMIVFEGQMSIGFLFTRARLSWDLPQYSYFNAAYIGLNIAGVLFGVSLLSHVLGLSDTLLAGICLLSALGAAITKSLATQSWHMYLSACIGMFTVVIGPVMRSIISKAVPAQDIGKVFSLTMSLELLSALGGASLFTEIYSHYLPPIYPAPVYLVSASFYATMILLVICLEVLIRSGNSTYVTLVQDE